MSRPILIAGATGKQGGATLRALLKHPAFDAKVHTIYAMTRNPESTSAKRLTSLSPSVKLVEGDLFDSATAFKNLAVKPWAVFLITNPFTSPPEDVVGKAFVGEALKAGVNHIVFSGVDRGPGNNGFNRTNVGHFKTKHDIEAYIKDKAQTVELTYTFLRPVYFLDNLFWGFRGKLLSTMWRDVIKRKFQVIDVADIGAIAARSILESSAPEFRNKAISLAGDELTFEEANKIFKDKTGQEIPVSYSFLASFAMWYQKELGEMFRFCDEPGYDADITYVRSLAPMSDFATWIERRKS